jgi:hypothetical protein
VHIEGDIVLVDLGEELHVGPVLERGPSGDAVVAAILRENPGARIVDRGSYVRVLVPERCEVSRHAIEMELGGAVTFPCDLERIMPSFKGAMCVTDDEVVWKRAWR